MNTTPPPQFTCVDVEELEAPSIATPILSSTLPTLFEPLPRGPALCNISTPLSTTYPGTQVRQPHMWGHEPNNMQLCTSSEDNSTSGTQHDLPNILPTPRREIQQFTAQVQGNWDVLFNFMRKQEKTVSELTQEMKVGFSHHDRQIADLAAKVEDNKSETFTMLTTHKRQEESKSDMMTKEIQQISTDELPKIESTLLSEFRFMVDQLQSEMQQDNKAIQHIFQTSHDHITTKLQQYDSQIDKLSTCVNEMNTEIVKGLQGQKKQIKEMLSLPQVVSTAVTSPSPAEAILEIASTSTLFSTSVSKSDHIKITFPTFGRASDDADPLLYLAKCQDFLALHPLTDADILATFRTVLYGTARDWWEVSRSSISTWKDELAERVRTKTQGEKESIRDFAFSYRALCKRWKPDLTEGEIIKMILKNIKPYLASQLRSRVSNVEELVKLGHQFEKDYEQQRRYESRIAPKYLLAPQKPSSNRPLDKILIQCWRCRGQHPPGKCPHYVPPQSPKSSGHQHISIKNPYSSPQEKGPAINHSMTATRMQKSSSATKKTSKSTSFNAAITIPQQLIVPISMDSWTGKAIVDSGASYTLLHESLWKQLTSPDQLHPWSLGPLYLANGDAEFPLGWMNATIHLHEQTFTLPVAVLSSQALAYNVVLGLDFIFFSGMLINVADQKYYFRLTPTKEHPFQPGNASVPTENSQQEHLKCKKTAQNLSLLSAIPPQSPQLLVHQPDTRDEQTLIKIVVEEAHVPPDGKQELLRILESNPRVCTLVTGRTDVLQHRIYSTCQVPIKQRPYRLQGIVEPSHSGWASPVVLVPKKDGKYRFCVDYRKINSVTESDAYPLPNISEILESLAGAAIFSTIDLNSGYWQVEIDPESKAKTAFITPAGLYEFNVMPFGLKNAPATFQRLMETVLGEARRKMCFVYIDDIIVYLPSVTQHFCDIQSVLRRLETTGLTINLKKSKFCLQEITFLGHVVSVQGISADPSKTQAIHAYPVPTNLKEVQRFLGLAEWYHQFVPNFSRTAEPLNSLKKKGHRFQWTTQCQQAFEQLKACLTSPPILGHPDFQYPFIEYTDASDTGLGAILAQQKDQCEDVIAYASRTLTRAELNYTATEKECLAVVWALEKWPHYLEPKLFTVVTDHSALQWVMNSTKTTSRLIRWVLHLQKFNFVIEYRKGKLNVALDALSRSSQTSSCNLYTSKKDSELPWSDDVLWEEQHKDLEVTKLLQALAENCGKLGDQYEIIQDKLYQKSYLANEKLHYRIYIPISLRTSFLQHYHSNPMSFWPGMWSDVKRQVRTCVKCQTLKSENQKPAGKLQQTTTTRPNQMLGVDIMGPLPRSTNQNEYLLVFIDYYSRWVELFPMRKATAQNVASIFRKEILTRWGVPDFILSDRGVQFISYVFRELCENWNVTPKLTTAYHPQTNMTERVNRTLKSMMAAYVEGNHKRWDQFLPEFRFALNSGIQETTGFSPAELQLGRKLQGPMDKMLQGRNLTPDAAPYDVVHHLHHLRTQAKESSKKAKLRQLRNYNKTRREVTFKSKDRVWLRNFPQSSAQHHYTAKLAPKWKGPYRVLQQLGPMNYQIALEETGEDVCTAHVCNLKMCFPKADELESREKLKLYEIFQETSDEDEEFLGF
ncbi:hypothetical protein IRJ41_013744 [Triplophysa rosa]|uniref:Reverse transcriptase n=1 Tax=Triplophysa rosa TaxID=992332 RepID=A0A9W7T2A8_TRIRA|nr:hypothetical protein IRJ41_013744 [Triplophysa rosa]